MLSPHRKAYASVTIGQGGVIALYSSDDLESEIWRQNDLGTYNKVKSFSGKCKFINAQMDRVIVDDQILRITEEGRVEQLQTIRDFKYSSLYADGSDTLIFGHSNYSVVQIYRFSITHYEVFTPLRNVKKSGSKHKCEGVHLIKPLPNYQNTFLCVTMRGLSKFTYHDKDVTYENVYANRDDILDYKIIDDNYIMIFSSNRTIFVID